MLFEIMLKIDWVAVVTICIIVFYFLLLIFRVNIFVRKMANIFDLYINTFHWHANIGKPYTISSIFEQIQHCIFICNVQHNITYAGLVYFF